MVPYTESSTQDRARGRSIGKARALQEIEKIRKAKIDRDQKKLEEAEKLRAAEDKRNRRAKKDV